MRRWARYRLFVPVFRSPHSAAHTARGVANGVFWGLTPTIGLQTLEILATWFIARRVLGKDSSLLQAMIWVWVNNPFTVLPLYYAFYVTGLWMMGDLTQAANYTAFAELMADNGTGWFDRVSKLAVSIGSSMLIGCVPYAIVGSTLAYRWASTIVRRRRARLARRRLDYETFRT
jgi:uncharacterized protein (DUF2062 family)